MEHWSLSIRPHLAGEGQVYFIVPMVGDDFPIAFGSDREAVSMMCAELNDAISWDSEMFVIEHLFTDSGGMNYEFYRDADKMGWF